ncbi:MAG: BON domain-containing protein [Elusimicrobia bacterium]|nr:BON domain-containing protein [Elusimicrobiota bacterium]
MEKILSFALVLAAVLASAEDANRPSGPARINPSQTIPPINPSQTITPPRPGSSPRPAATPPLTARVFIAITRGVNAARGMPPFGEAGIPIDGLVVASDRGSVILTGVARTARDRAEAGARAEAIAGAGNVVNRLTVGP